MGTILEKMAGINDVASELKRFCASFTEKQTISGKQTFYTVLQL